MGGVVSPAVSAPVGVHQEAPTEESKRFTLENADELKNGYVTSPRDVKVTEKSDNKIPKQNVHLELIHNGESSALEDGEWTLTESKGTDSKYVYTYTVKAENFKHDGRYKIVAYTHSDQNRNTMDLDHSFTVSSHNPVIQITGVAEGGNYGETDKDATISVRSASPIDSLRVILNGQKVKAEQSPSGDYIVKIHQAKGPQTLEVVAMDKAGHSATQKVENFVVSPSMFTYLMSQKWFLVLMSVLTAALAMVVGGAVYMSRKKKKKDSRNQSRSFLQIVYADRKEGTHVEDTTSSVSDTGSHNDWVD